jgi:hypothetical protein
MKQRQTHLKYFFTLQLGCLGWCSLYAWYVLASRYNSSDSDYNLIFNLYPTAGLYTPIGDFSYAVVCIKKYDRIVIDGSL